MSLQIEFTNSVASYPLVPVAATVAAAAMMCLPHPDGTARALQVIAYAFAHGSFPAAVFFAAFAVALASFGVWTAFAVFSKARAGNVAAAILFLVYAIVFFVWQIGPFVG